MPDTDSWKPIEGGALDIDWTARPLPARLDPYLVWADASRVLDAVAQEPRGIQVTVEWSGNSTPPGVEPAMSAGALSYGTALVNATGVRELLHTASVERLELGSAPARADARPAPKVAENGRLTGSVLAVIDAGCAFAHTTFRTFGADRRWHTRIRALWDQNADVDHPRSAPWRQPAGRRYGRELDNEAIDALLQTHARGVDIDEDAIYRETFCAAELAPPVVHGTHVTDLAAGARPANDAASRAHILFVHLPHFAVADTSGASMVGPLADALGWILERVASDAALVVNLSYGSMAGPHDGSTIVERMLDAVAVSGQRRAVVLPAGNNHEASAHAKFTLDDAHRMVTLHWEVMVGDATDSFLELWYPRSAAARVRVTLRPPAGPPCTVGVDELQGWATSGGLRAAAIHLNQASAGDADAMVLLALAPTSRRPGEIGRRPLAPAGVWEVDVALDANAGVPVTVWAWIERDDPAPDPATAARQSRLLTNRLPAGPDQADDPVTRGGTGNSIANGNWTFVAAGCVGAAENAPAASYSSAGPTRNSARERQHQLPWPNAAVPCEASSALGGIAAASTRSGTTRRMNGTSVAAPQLARWLLNKLEQRVRGNPEGGASQRLANILREEVSGVGPADRFGPGRLLR